MVSDYIAITMLMTFHHVARDEKEDAIKVLKAGVDVELPTIRYYGEPLLRAVEEGLIPESLIDKAVSRVLHAKFMLGLFEKPYVDLDKVLQVLDSDEDRRLALMAARKSIVLLKNDGILPLKDVSPIALIGPNAHDPENMLGDYTYTAHLDLDKPMVRVTTVLEALKRRAEPKVKVYCAKGCDMAEADKEELRKAIDVTSKADVIVTALEKGLISPRFITDKRRDRALLSLPKVGRASLPV